MGQFIDTGSISGSSARDEVRAEFSLRAFIALQRLTSRIEIDVSAFPQAIAAVVTFSFLDDVSLDRGNAQS